ncbi:general substrate transporter [Peziza echinospora]|nr:general substrate transporter [Peziza echinospora]
MEQQSPDKKKDSIEQVVEATPVDSRTTAESEKAASTNTSKGSRKHLSAPHQEKPTKWLWFLTTIAAISGFLFGYDTGVISGALVVIGTDLGTATELSNGQKELITSATSLGALFAGVCAGTLADKMGRKWVIAIADVVFIVGAIMQAVSKDLWVMIAGRFVIGWGVGLASLIVPLYLAELSPAQFRGRMIVINVLFITFGQVIAYAIGAGLENVPDIGWRLMVGIGAIPAAVQLLSIYWLPESPRYLVRKGKAEDAKAVLARIYEGETDEQLDIKIKYLVEYVNVDLRKYAGSGETKMQIWVRDAKELFTIGRNVRALVIACGLQAVQQLCGFNSLMYFSATIFKSVGFENPVAVSLIIAGTNFVMTCVAFCIIDKIGRRRILVGTIWGMSFGLTVCAIAFHYLPRGSDGEIASTGTNRWAILILISQIVYVMFYALGIGNVPWLSQSEIFTYNVRGLGTGMATATNWAGNLLIGSTFLTMMDKLTPSGAFGFYAALCAVGWVFVVGWYPDLSGFTLEEVGEILQDSFGVEESRKRKKLLQQLDEDDKRKRQELLEEKI